MKSQVFKDEVLSRTESADQPAEEMSERRDHNRNHIGKVRIELCAKSFILQVYDVLARHNYQENELPKKAWSTQKTVETTLRIWVFPNSGEHKLVDVRTVQVESWLHGLSLANHTKAKIRNVMHIVFTHACRHEWLEKNPLTLVRQSAKRQRLPDVLELDELRLLLGELANPAHLLVFLNVATACESRKLSA